MRRSFLFVAGMQILVLAGCVASTPRPPEMSPQPPKIEGAVGSVSQKDIRRVIALVEQSTRHEFGRVFPIECVQIHNRNEITIIYHRDTLKCWIPVGAFTACGRYHQKVFG